jgi:putative glycosyltransferase (TIGR04372 family)
MIRSWVPNFIIHLILFVTEKRYRDNHSLLGVPRLYFKWIAPNVAVYFSWILSPAYLKIKKANLFFLINNISFSPGHVVSELDWFFRRIEIGELPSDRHYVVIWPRSEVARYTRDVYRGRFHAFIVSDFMYCVLLPIIMRYPDITVDCGLSTMNLTLGKHQSEKSCAIARKNRLSARILPRSYMEVWDRHASCYALKGRAQGFNPMKPGDSMSVELAEFLGESVAKYAVIHIKTQAYNATAVETDPLTYLRAIALLVNEGYGIVFAGREQMPEIFQSLGVLNFAEWKKANFRYDLELIAGSGFVLSAGSGFGMLPATMDIPMVYCNSWHLVTPLHSHLSVTLPTLLHGEDGDLMRFCDQIDFFYSRGESGSPPPQFMKPRNATSTEILEAVKEALSLKKCFCNPSSLQNQYKSLRPGSPLFVAESRISQYFIEHFKNLL